MELRRFREEDREALVRLGVTAFGAGIDYWRDYYTSEKNPRIDLERVYVVEADGEARATAAVLPLEVFADGEPVTMGGVAAVNTHPTYRRRGYAGKLLRNILDDLRGQGVHLSLLSPFSHGFYRAYGWELATEGIGYTLKPDELPTSDEQRFVRDCLKGDLQEMRRLLEAEAARHTCCVRRGEGLWRRILADEKGKFENLQAAVYEKEGGVDGYLLYRQSEREGRAPLRRLTIYELVARTPEARAGLISFAAAYDPLEFEVKYKTPRGEPLHPYLPSSYVDAKIEPDMMLRIVDVEGTLSLLKRDIGESLVLEVSEDVVPENVGSYTVGNGEVMRGSEVEARVTLDVRQLAQLYAGYLPARQLAHHGLVQAGSRRALELLEALFPAGDPWVFSLDRF